MNIPHHDRPATMAAKQKRARDLAYLGNVSTIMTHLANEFGPDVPLPSVKFIEMVLFERANQQRVTAHYATRKTGGTNV